MHEESVITRTVRTAPGVLGPGHLGKLTQTITGLALIITDIHAAARGQFLGYNLKQSAGLSGD